MENFIFCAVLVNPQQHIITKENKEQRSIINLVLNFCEEI